MVATTEQLTTAQAARVLGISEQTVRVWTRIGRLPATITPLGALYDVGDVHDLAEAREREHRDRPRTKYMRRRVNEYTDDTDADDEAGPA